jgi:hypothetical protein
LLAVLHHLENHILLIVLAFHIARILSRQRVVHQAFAGFYRMDRSRGKTSPHPGGPASPYPFSSISISNKTNPKNTDTPAFAE